ncbi:DNA-binding response regulator [candidate division WOR-1 bacterium RIFCSPLOWO2_02_FULL_46_20]|uniref:DNA-binding response regulator n=2 Tax=Saganbacteria TaxID=1703751 RepID=A0A1F4R806_UNCSA|nr:MAG: DNA-binding response regulator [candidate division WOR-1 bacterium RIFCSPHIGHO2_02_FULL_45_12]OGC04365.1 MAG: DNA-binding response regulator [candidate division WOR-1 bacterium RIFCSPLOWO2_02_FULL_46_20]OGC10115.1 MAG: DNA-binding response regulator [candidate division WOR-1 bacterium RIFCSPLOWO2_12_FULL_45_9]
MSHLLIIEDEKDIVEAIEYNLKKENFKVSKAYDGSSGLRLAREKKPDLIILDLMLPLLDGFEVCKNLKKETKTADIPIIMLTAKSSEVDKVLGLELGADDYMTKPFSMRELIARVRTILKRYGAKKAFALAALKFPDLEINWETHEVKVLGGTVELTAMEFKLLQYLAENEGRVFSRERLLDNVWGVEVAIETRTVDVHMRRLREKLGKAGKHLKTLRGVGYKFV